MTFRMPDFIEKKKLAREHSPDSIEQFIKSLVANEIPDYQTAAWLMAVRLNGMTDLETASLTNAMAQNGEIINLDDFPNSADKHSTGGVGDKTTLIAAPLAAACGVPVIKFSGRALDFTGGTLDKLESIPGFQTSLSSEHIKKQASDIGLVLAGTSKNMVPADKILYSLRDVTSTVDSIPLIAASIISKKIAGGAANIVLDVKFGDGAFMQKYDDAKSLANSMVSIGTKLGKKVRAILSSMDSPLGQNVGNTMEVIEAIEVLKGNGNDDLVELSVELASRMVALSRGDDDFDSIKAEVLNRISDASALKKFKSMITAQGGDERIIDDYGILPHAEFRFSYTAPESGFISKIAMRQIGNLVRQLGGGRLKKDDVIDPAVGLRFFKWKSYPVEKGERIVDAYYNDKQHKELIESTLKSAIETSDSQGEITPLIREII
ncbi:thymidine phosphorylase [bacterium]|nr:thymidine phosphorylase [bacterium]